MCDITKNVLKNVLEMQADLAKDGELNSPISDIGYQADMLINASECSEQLATALASGLIAEADKMLASGEILWRIECKDFVHFTEICIYEGMEQDMGSRVFYLPRVDGMLHWDSCTHILKHIANKYNDAVWYS